MISTYMASAGDSLDENGLQQVEEQHTDNSVWSNLPPPVFNTLCAMMERSFIHTARQVCPNWLTNTEHEVGLKVKIDDTLHGNIEFVQSVKVVEARIVNWRRSFSSSDELLLFPTCLVKLIISGIMPDGWQIKELRQFSNLSHLVIRGAALRSQDLTGIPLPPGAFTMQEDQNSVLENFEPNMETSPIWLKRLTKLEIIMNEFSYPSGLPLSVRLYQPERTIEHEASLKQLYFVVLNNITYILNNVRSPRLHVAQFYIYPKAGTFPPDKLNWRHGPLQRFLANHKASLKQLYLPDFEGKHNNTEDDLRTFPVKLRKLQITLSKYIGDREEARQQDINYWKHFLMEQSELVDVYIILSDVPAEWTTDCLSFLAFASKETLTYVDVVLEQSEDLLQINLELFTFCNKLQVLKLSGRVNEISIRNFCKLPPSLKKVYVSTAALELPDPAFLHKYTQLEMIDLKVITIGSGGMDFQQRNHRTVGMIRELLKLRKLSLISLSFDTPLNIIPEAMVVLQNLDRDFDPSYPTYTMKLNLSYEFIAGWSEETFDEETLQIEYINTREPEEYSWRSRHRNAISVDEDDHRIFIFQTLPFLLDIRGRGPDVEDPDWENDEDDDEVTIEPISDASEASTQIEDEDRVDSSTSM